MEIAELVESKDKKYNRAFDKAVSKYGPNYYLSKIYEKQSRLDYMVMNKIEDPESIEDTLQDIMGYCLLTLRSIRGE